MKTKLYIPVLGSVLIILSIVQYTSATKFRIAVSDFLFTPKSIANVRVGDTIRWFWVTGTHTTTSDTIPAGAAAWNHPIDISDTVFDYVPSQTGVYKYHCVPHEAANMVGSFTVISANAVENTIPDAHLTIYPNPVFYSMTVRVSSAYNSIRDLRIFNLAGNLVGEEHFTTTPGISDITVNLSDLVQGIYLLEFIDNHNNHYIRKITKL